MEVGEELPKPLVRQSAPLEFGQTWNGKTIGKGHEADGFFCRDAEPVPVFAFPPAFGVEVWASDLHKSGSPF